MRETDFSTDYSGYEFKEVSEIPVEDDINQMVTPDHLSLSESTSNQTGKGSVIQIPPSKVVPIPK